MTTEVLKFKHIIHYRNFTALQTKYTPSEFQKLTLQKPKHTLIKHIQKAHTHESHALATLPTREHFGFA